MREGVVGLLDALREGLGAEALALFDDDRAEPDAASDPGQLSFWDAFAGLPCVELDWRDHYAALRTTKRFEATCACAERHRIDGFLIHDRWVLILVRPAQLTAGAVAVYMSGIGALADRLPPGKPPEGPSDAWYREPSQPKAGGARLPIWWVRRPRE